MEITPSRDSPSAGPNSLDAGSYHIFYFFIYTNVSENERLITRRLGVPAPSFCRWREIFLRLIPINIAPSSFIFVAYNLISAAMILVYIDSSHNHRWQRAHSIAARQILKLYHFWLCCYFLGALRFISRSQREVRFARCLPQLNIQFLEQSNRQFLISISNLTFIVLCLLRLHLRCVAIAFCLRYIFTRC